MIHERIGMIFDHRDLLRDEFLDITEILFLLSITEGYSDPACSGSTGTTDSMDIGF